VVDALFQHPPERHVRIVAMPGEVCRRHAERQGLHLECTLAAEKRLACQRVDLADLIVGHGVAAARRAVAMHHQVRAGAAPRFVIGVGKAHVERQVELRVRVHLRRGDGIETLGRLAVAFLDLRPKLARPAADRIGLEQVVAAARVLLPDFELGLFLEQPHQDRRLGRHVLLRQRRHHFGRQRLHRLAVLQAIGIATGERHHGAKRR
jgi:hypothetical protein